MEEIAREIADRAYTVGYSKTDSTIETDAALVHEVTLPQTEEETLAETTVESTGQPEMNRRRQSSHRLLHARWRQPPQQMRTRKKSIREARKRRLTMWTTRAVR